MRTAFLFLSLSLSSVLIADLNSLWEQALEKSGAEKIEALENWISEAENSQVVSPESYFNLAQAYWEQDKVGLCLESLFKSVHVEKNFFRAWSKINLISGIQKVLADQASPIDRLGLRLHLIYENNIKPLGRALLSILFTLTLLLRFGFYPAIKIYRFFFVSLLLSVMGYFLLYFNGKNTPLPIILDNGTEAVSLYNSTAVNSQEVIAELPSGLLVTPDHDEEDWVAIQYPMSGWISKSQIRGLAFTSRQ